jgi:hypothetical protein
MSQQGGSDMPGMSGMGGMSGMAGMYLHFAGGDFLIFKGLAPKSTGQLVGASIVLFCLALFERWVSVIRAVLETRWRQRFVALVNVGLLVLRWK